MWTFCKSVGLRLVGVKIRVERVSGHKGFLFSSLMLFSTRMHGIVLRLLKSPRGFYSVSLSQKNIWR